MTKTYSAYFYRDVEYASTDIEADPPEEALAAACKMNEDDDGSLHFEKYDEPHPVNHIEILDQDHNELAHWRDADLLLRMAGPDLLEALQFCDDARRSRSFGTQRLHRRGEKAGARGSCQSQAGGPRRAARNSPPFLSSRHSINHSRTGGR